MSSGQVLTAVAAVSGAVDALAGLSFDQLSHAELLDVLGELETATRKLPTQSHRILARLAAEASPTELGARSLREVLRSRLRISGADARRRLCDASQLGPRTAISGETLEPVLTATAAAQATGTIGAEHVRIIRAFFDTLPGSIDVITRAQAEATLVHAAAGLDPDALRKAAERLRAYLDQDGPMPDDAERARRRYLSIGRQGPDGMTPIQGNLDPHARATFDAILAKLAAPGMCNPDDLEPRLSGTPSQQQIDGDTRSIGQRNHDALTAVGRNAIASGELGQHNGLPVTISVSTTLAELESAAGYAVTAGGSLLPMADVIRMASHAHHYLLVYAKHKEVPLYLGRAQRCASVGQRIVLHARDRGCTAPGCTVPGYGCQVHHIAGWVKDNGPTDITHEVLACPADNRRAELGYTVRIRPDGQVEWIPPPHLDTGQARINTYHHPERVLTDPDEPDPEVG